MKTEELLKITHTLGADAVSPVTLLKLFWVSIKKKQRFFVHQQVYVCT